MCQRIRSKFSKALEQFWPDAIPDARDWSEQEASLVNRVRLQCFNYRAPAAQAIQIYTKTCSRTDCTRAVEAIKNSLKTPNAVCGKINYYVTSVR